MLDRPKGKIRAVLDTDTYNEIDDQFALAYMLKKSEKFNIKAITAAPFYNEKSSSPEDGMNLSYNEILNIINLMEKNENVLKGSICYLPNEKTPVDSPAAREIIRLANSENDLLYIIAIGAITNVASALLIDPSIMNRAVVVWLGGHAHYWNNTAEFNMKQDIAAARVVFDSGAPVVQLPCMGVVSHLATTGPELDYWLRGKNKLCDYLAENVKNEVEKYAKGTAWSRVIWDISAIAWFLDDKFTSGHITPSPICEYNNTYSFDSNRHKCKVIDYVNRDLIFTDMFKTLANV